MRIKFPIATLVALLLLAKPISILALPFYSELVVIGDSLSDQGNFAVITGGAIPAPEYTDGVTTGRFTNGQNYIDYLSADLGLTVLPSELGGRNYAYGSALTGSAPDPGLGTKSMLEQRDQYISDLAGASADPDALHAVWGGGNDLRDAIERALADPMFDPTPVVLGAAANIGDIVASLALVGATTIIVPNMPNLGLQPLITAGGPPVAGATALAAGFNMALEVALAQVVGLFPFVNIIDFDMFSLSTAAYLDPAAFGFTNVTDACYSEFIIPGGTICSSPETYLSWDGFHPTTTAHGIVADQIAAQLMPVVEPGTAFLVVLGVAGVVRVRRQFSPRVQGRPLSA